MRPVLSTEEVIRLENLIDKEGMSKAELMEHAGEFVAHIVEKVHPDHVAVFTGFGNNGGDGWVAADILSGAGIRVDVITPVSPDEIKSSLARHVARRTAERDVNVVVGPSRDELVDLLNECDLIVDAILGTGFSGNLRPPFSIWIPTINESGLPVVSVDVPSGLDADTGHIASDCVCATTTATMIVPKVGLYSGEASAYVGELVCGSLYEGLDRVIADVDHAAEIVDPADLIDVIPDLPAYADKYSRGSVLVVGGSAQYPGAAIMAAKSAARAGAGYVAVAAPEDCANIIRLALPSVPVFSIPADTRGAFGAAAFSAVREHARKFDCVVCGPGMTTTSGGMQVVTDLLTLDVPLVLDADGLNCLSRLAIGGIDATPELYRREAPLILTPHYRELSRLVDDEDVCDLTSAVEAAQKILWAAGSDNMVVVAKGPTTAIVGVEKVFLPQSGPASLATAGSGDVLAGIIAANVATSHGGVDRWELLVAYAVAVHSYTGYAAASLMGEKSVIATDLIDCIGDAMQMVETAALKDAGIEMGE